jgi:transaldolase
MEEAGLDAYDHMSLMKDLERHSTNRCKILVASIRSVEQMMKLAAQGHVYFTISPAIADELLSAELTVKAVSEFDEAAAKHKVLG